MSGERDGDFERGARRQSRSDRNRRADLADEPGRGPSSATTPATTRPRGSNDSGSVRASGTSAGAGSSSRHEDDSFAARPPDDRRAESIAIGNTCPPV